MITISVQQPRMELIRDICPVVVADIWNHFVLSGLRTTIETYSAQSHFLQYIVSLAVELTAIVLRCESLLERMNTFNVFYLSLSSVRVTLVIILIAPHIREFGRFSLKLAESVRTHRLLKQSSNYAKFNTARSNTRRPDSNGSRLVFSHYFKVVPQAAKLIEMLGEHSVACREIHIQLRIILCFSLPCL